MPSPERVQADDGRLPPGAIVGNYRLVECIGQGSFALVYRAQHSHLEREVAIKILRDVISEDDTFRERFRREAVAAAKIVHPNVVGVHDFGETSGLAYLVMEWVKGRTLHRAIAEGQDFPPERVAHLLRQIALGLEAAHKLGLIHRDLKSGNVMLAEIDDASVEAAKIVDFGLVRATFDEHRLTEAGQVLGTPQFMDPEMIVGREATTSTDLYALGIIGFQLLMGRLPFTGNTPIDVMRKQVTEPPPELPSARGLESIVGGLLQKEARLRPPSAGAVAAAIDALAISPWRPQEPGLLRTEARAAAVGSEVFEKTPVMVTPRASLDPRIIASPRTHTIALDPSSQPSRSHALRISYGDRQRTKARWLIAGVSLAGVAVVAAAWARFVYESGSQAAVVRDLPVVDIRPLDQVSEVHAVALPVPRPATEAIAQDVSDASKDVRRPSRVHRDGPTRVAPSLDVGSLRLDLARSLDDMGLEVRDLASFDALAPRFERFDRAIAAHDANEAQAALQDLRSALASTSIPVPFLKAKLKRVNAQLGKMTHDVPAADLQKLELEYLDLETEVHPGIRDSDAINLAKRIKKLDIRLHASVQ